mmetsp:Transcript_21442/g.55721  ORF Transcript_21442/g.55721 Transcript_21442/m.55721 type:complete len:114 (-) Transcript_21442:1405-1746(-)
MFNTLTVPAIDTRFAETLQTPRKKITSARKSLTLRASWKPLSAEEFFTELVYIAKQHEQGRVWSSLRSAYIPAISSEDFDFLEAEFASVYATRGRCPNEGELRAFVEARRGKF